MSTTNVPRRELGKSGLTVSMVGLGCMGMSFGLNDSNKLSEEECIKVIQEAYRLGVNFFDTAEVYGPHTNEVIVGKALKPFPRESVVIATKCGIYNNENGSYTDSKRETIRKSIEGSLERLQTSYVDLYYVHRVDKTIPIEEVAKTMLELKEEGKIRHWGLSEASVTTIRRAHAVFPLTAVQSEFSIAHRDPEEKLLPALEELGIGLVSFSPLCRALLTGKVDKNSQFEAGDIRATMPRFNAYREQNLKYMELIEDFAQRKKATPAQIALAWVCAQKPFIVPIPGTTKIERLKENVGSTAIHFTEEEMKEFNGRLNEYKTYGDRYGIKSQMDMIDKD